MNLHLRALAAKDYRAAILASWRDAGRSNEIRRILNVMYLPNEGVLERLRAADPEFDRRAAAAQIVPVGPAGLAGLVGFARLDIDYGRQMENQERIVEAARRLVEAIGIALGHADRVGKNLKTAADGFADFAASINGRVLPRARVLEKLGVRPQKTRGLPQQVPAYQLVDLSQPTIEGEAEEVAGDAPEPLPADPP
jgi:DNA anti-recombination protein RmuC